MSANTVLPHGGGELSSFDPQDNACFEITNAGTFDPAVSRCAIRVSTGSLGFKSPTWAAASEFWFHGMCSPDNTGVNSRQIVFWDGAVVVLKVSQSGTTWTVQSLQSGVLTTVGSLNAVGLAVVDLRLVAGASGIVEGYLAGTNIFRVTGLNHTGFTGVTQIQCYGPDSGGFSSAWSQIINDATGHVGSGLVTIAIDTASVVNTGWSGPVSNINEIVLNDAANVTSSAADQVGTYYKSGFSLGSYNILALFIGARAQLTTGSSTNIQLAIRTAGSNYFSPTIALDFGYQACCASWTQNPATSSAWTASQAAVVEGGMKSIA